MNKRKVILIVAFLLGLIAGPSMLMSARAAVPPIDWNAIPFVVIGSIVGAFFIIGIQIARKNHKPAKFILRVFVAISTAILGSGISAFVISVINYGVIPSGVFIAAWGIGLAVGVALSYVLYRLRYRNVL